MFLLLSFSLVRGELINLTLNNVAQIIGGPRPVLAKFSSAEYCYYCLDSALPFSEASTMFSDVIFADINCPEQEDICEQFEVRGFPSVQLFLPTERTGREFEGEHHTMEYVYFIQNRTRFRARTSPYAKLTHLTERTWQKWADNLTCGLTLFHWERCAHCRHILPQLGLIAELFEPDPQISIAAVSCDRYRALCQKLNVQVNRISDEPSPVIRYFVNKTWYSWIGANMTRDLLGLVNGQCGMDRGLDGLLGDNSGTIPEADLIARTFIDSENRTEMIEKIRKIPGSEFYSRMMERMIDQGIEQLQKDATTLKKNLEKKTGSRTSLDEMKRRYNVISRFLPTSTPHPRIKRKGMKKSINPQKEL
jgi:thiol-disulfide isomerase/thioredoxin